MEEKIENFKVIYQKIKEVKCLALNNEVVRFNKHGYIHILRKGRFPRKFLQKKKRLPNIKKHTSTNSIGHFWTIKSNVGNKVIRVVIRQLNDGMKHFFSIMDED